MAKSTQKALVVKELGKPLSLVTDWPIPEPGAGQVQIRVTAASLNPHDQKSRDIGLFIQDHLPAALANDVVGEVTALGPDVTKYSLGDHIFGQGNFTSNSSQNGFQEYAVLDVDFSAKVPKGFTDNDMATLSVNTIAALVALFDASTLAIPAPWTAGASGFDYANMSILVVGGGSNCGRAGVQLAALAGIGRVIVIGGDEAELKSLGATHVISRHDSPDDIVTHVRKIVGDELKYVYDAINPPSTQFIGVNALSTKGTGKLVRLLPFGPVDETHVKLKRGDYEVFDSHGSSHVKVDLTRPFWDRWLSEYLVQKKIALVKYTVVEGLAADKANQILDTYRESGKVVKTIFRVKE